MRREGWWALLALGVGGLAAADRVFASYWDFPAAAGELPEAARAYRAAGLPWTAADIAPPPIPASLNAAPLLKAAIAALPSGKELSRIEDRAQYGEPIGNLAEFARALRLAHLAAGRPKLNFNRDWGLGPNLTFRENYPVKRICRLLAVRAELSAKAGGDARALADLDDARRIAILIGCEPTLISSSSGAACELSAMTGAQRCLVAAHADPPRLERYRSWLAKDSPLPDLVRALRGEIYTRVASARNFDGAGVGQGILPIADYEPNDCHDSDCSDRFRRSGPSDFRREGLPQNNRSRAYMARCLQMWTELAQATHGLSLTAEEIGYAADAVQARYENAKGLSHGLDAMLFPAYGRFGQANRAMEANRAVSLAFADALILHARTGRWPVTITTPDPLGKGPLKVRFDGQRFRVWSVGRNGKDERGLLSREMEGSKSSDDVVAAYPPVPPAPRPKSPPPGVGPD